MTRKLSTLILFLLIHSFSYAQVGIGITNPNANLDIVSSNTTTPSNIDGVLIPRIDNFSTTNPTIAQNGMLVFATGNGTPLKGFYYWNQPTLTWIAVGGNSGVKKIDDLLDGKSDSDGTQDGSSVFLGINAGLKDDSSDNSNVAIGFESLRTNITGYFNTAVGYQTLNFNTSFDNTAIGAFSLQNNTVGQWNTASGAYALSLNTTGNANAAMGVSALHGNTTGYWNTATGVNALFTNTTGYNNTSLGVNSLFTNISGYQNVANGVETLYLNTTGYWNTATGFRSMYNNTTGFHNTAIGDNSLFSNISGKENIAAGSSALFHNTTGYWDTSVGAYSLLFNTIGIGNTASGMNALLNNTTGNYNTAFGIYSIYNNTTGNYNTAVGYSAGWTGVLTGLTNATALGSNTFNTASNQVRIGENTVTSIGGFVNWTTVSDKRFKKNINENVKGLDFILKLRPVTYNLDLDKINNYLKIPDSISKGKNGELIKFKKAKEKEVQTGFIAQEVEKIAKETGFNFSGVDKPKNNNDYYGLRYAEFVVPLVKAMQEQQKIIDQLKKELYLQKKQIKTLLNK